MLKDTIQKALILRKKGAEALLLCRTNPYLCTLKSRLLLMNEKNTGADLKSATGDGDKKLYIETYGCQMTR